MLLAVDDNRVCLGLNIGQLSQIAHGAVGIEAGDDDLLLAVSALSK